VEICTDSKLIALGNKRIEEIEAIGEARKELKNIDADILNRMHMLGLKNYRVDSKLFRIDEKEAVKVSKIKDAPPAAQDEAGEAPLESPGA
jgi:hypothetical protein